MRVAVTVMVQRVRAPPIPLSVILSLTLSTVTLMVKHQVCTPIAGKYCVWHLQCSPWPYKRLPLLHLQSRFVEGYRICNFMLYHVRYYHKEAVFVEGVVFIERDNLHV